MGIVRMHQKAELSRNDWILKIEAYEQQLHQDPTGLDLIFCESCILACSYAAQVAPSESSRDERRKEK